MSGTTMVILSAFVAYLLLMIVIGVVYMKKTSSSEDYFLGGRGPVSYTHLTLPTTERV